MFPCVIILSFDLDTPNKSIPPIEDFLLQHSTTLVVDFQYNTTMHPLLNHWSDHSKNILTIFWTISHPSIPPDLHFNTLNPNLFRLSSLYGIRPIPRVVVGLQFRYTSIQYLILIIQDKQTNKTLVYIVDGHDHSFISTQVSLFIESCKGCSNFVFFDFTSCIHVVLCAPFSLPLHIYLTFIDFLFMYIILSMFHTICVPCPLPLWHQWQHILNKKKG